MLIGVCSAKGAPGASTLAVATAFEASAVLVEADRSGGCLRHRLKGLSDERLPVRPNLDTLIQRCSSTPPINPQTLVEHVIPTRAGLGVVLAAEPTAQNSAVAASRKLLPAFLASGMDVVVDLGRLEAGSPAEDLAAGMDALFWISTDNGEELTALKARQRELKAKWGGGGPRVELTFVVSDGAWTRLWNLKTISDFLGAYPIMLPHDRKAVRALYAGPTKRTTINHVAAEGISRVAAAINLAVPA